MLIIGIRDISKDKHNYTDQLIAIMVKIKDEVDYLKTKGCR